MTKTEPISVRDFLRNFATIVQCETLKRYLIMKHGRPIGMFTPWGTLKEELKKRKDDQAKQLLWLGETETQT
jgi:hypothetical protein